MGAGGVRMCVRPRQDGGCTILVDLSPTSSAGWIFSADGTCRCIVGESRGPVKGG